MSELDGDTNLTENFSDEAKTHRFEPFSDVEAIDERDINDMTAGSKVYIHIDGNELQFMEKRAEFVTDYREIYALFSQCTDLFRVNYYNTEVMFTEKTAPDHSYIRKLLDFLKQNGYNVVCNTLRIPKDKFDVRLVDRSYIAMQMALHSMQRLAVRNPNDVFIIFSNNASVLPLIHEIKRTARVIVVGMKGLSAGRELAYAADNFIDIRSIRHLITRTTEQ